MAKIRCSANPCKVSPMHKLSPSQSILLAAMRSGVAVHFLSGLDPYYFRSDTMARCTKGVEVLIQLGLAERYDEDWRGAKVRAKTQ